MERNKIKLTSTKHSQNYLSKKDEIDQIIKTKEQNERKAELKSRDIQYNDKNISQNKVNTTVNK